MCRLWHHLFASEVLTQTDPQAFAVEVGEYVQVIWVSQPRVPLVAEDEMAEARDGSGWNAPSIDDLNEDTGREFDGAGVRETTGEDLARLEPGTGAGSEVAESDGERLRELAIRRMMVIDVRGDREPGQCSGRRGR